MFVRAYSGYRSVQKMEPPRKNKQINSYRPCTIKQPIRVRSGTYSPAGRRIASDAGGLGFESQTGRVRGKSTPSLWRNKHPAIKGLRLFDQTISRPEMRKSVVCQATTAR